MMVYLAGPINARDFDGASTWRNEMTAALAAHGIKTVDPLREGGFLPTTDKTDEEIVERDIADVDRCGVFLANLKDVKANGEVFVGTSMELYHAANTGSYCVVIANDLHSPWIRYFASAIVPDEATAVAVIKALHTALADVTATSQAGTY